MANLLRLIGSIVLLCLPGLTAAQTCYGYTVQSLNTAAFATFSSAAAACAFARPNNVNGYSYSTQSVTEQGCVFVRNDGGILSSQIYRDNAECVNDEEAHCQSINGSPVKTQWPSTSMALTENKPVCMSGGVGYNCSSTVETTMCAQGAGGAITCYGTGTVTGGACTPSPTPETPVAPTDPATNWPSAPPPGMCPGQINGVTVHVPCSNTTTGSTKTTQANDGAGTTTGTTEKKNTTCNAAGSCTTTTTTTTTINGGSSNTKTTSTTQGKGEFCAGNPGAKECGEGNGSSFGGSCSGGFVCDGDALQCAMAKEQHKRACALFETESDERQAYEADKLKGEAGTDQTENLPGNQTVDIGPADFDSSDAIGGAQCITDKSVTIAGQSVSIPLSSMCPYLAYLGQLLVVVGYLLGARILIRG